MASVGGAQMISKGIVVLILIIITAGLSVTSWHFLSRFLARKHPLSIVAALLPVGWWVAALLSLSEGLLVRSLVLTVAFLEAIGSAVTVLSTRHSEKARKG